MMHLHFPSLIPMATKASATLDRVTVGGGVLEPRGPVSAGNAQILLNAVAIMMMIVVPDDPRDLRFRLVVSRLEQAGDLQARLDLFRAHRAHRLGHSAARRPVSERRDLDRLA